MATLKSRIFVPTALLAVVVGATLAALAWQTARQARALQVEVGQIRAANALVFALTDAADEEQRWVLSYRFRPGQQVRARIAAEELRIERLLDEIATLDLRPRAAELWREYTAARAQLLGARDELMALPVGADPRATALAFDKWTLTTDRANGLLASFASYHVRRLERAITDLERGRSSALRIAAGAIALGVLLAVAFSTLLARSLVRPIGAMAATAERIADQGLAVPVAGAERADEIGSLARAFNRMTERLVSANERLAEAVRARDEFISIASHELKTPLTPLKLQLQGLLRSAQRAQAGEVPMERVTHGMRNFERLVTRVGQLVENMLDVSRITSGRLVLEVDEVPVRALLEEVAHRLEHQLAEAGCPIRVECEHEGTVQGDRLRLGQVLENLVGNAAKYAPGGLVTLRARTDAGALLLEVEDRGQGIAPEDQQRIFARFERAVRDARHIGGLGLGLYIAREIVRAHGGDISVASEVGRGATFRVALPLPVAPGVDAARGVDGTAPTPAVTSSRRAP